MDPISSVATRMADIQTRIATITGTAGPSVTTSTPGSFATAYSSAVSTMNTASAASQLNSDGVPISLVAYGNGKVPAPALEQVGTTGHRLWAPAASALENMMAAAKRDGVQIGITDSYRSYAEQVDLANRKGLYSQGGLAAKPGTSDHGWGLATDLDLDSRALTWMRANGARFGFVENTPRESWHWVFEPKA
jgi:LAS superfamily LD-carboxypeptidase LdcB